MGLSGRYRKVNLDCIFTFLICLLLLLFLLFLLKELDGWELLFQFFPLEATLSSSVSRFQWNYYYFFLSLFPRSRRSSCYTNLYSSFFIDCYSFFICLVFFIFSFLYLFSIFCRLGRWIFCCGIFVIYLFMYCVSCYLTINLVIYLL